MQSLSALIGKKVCEVTVTILMLSIQFVTEKLTSFVLIFYLVSGIAGGTQVAKQPETRGKRDCLEFSQELKESQESKPNRPKTSGRHGNHCRGERDLKKSKETLTFS